MPETENDGVIQVTLLASDLTLIIDALTHWARTLENDLASSHGYSMPIETEGNIRSFYALAGRLDDIR